MNAKFECLNALLFSAFKFGIHKVLSKCLPALASRCTSSIVGFGYLNISTSDGASWQIVDIFGNKVQRKDLQTTLVCAICFVFMRLVALSMLYNTEMNRRQNKNS